MTLNERFDLGVVAREIIDTNLYMTIGTVLDDGRPWVSPVYYATEDRWHFYWVSSPEATHSRNIGLRPQVSIVVFNSEARIGTGQGLYMSAFAEELAGAELNRGIDIFSRRSLAHGGRAWPLVNVEPPTPYRLYRATASEHWVLDPESHPDHRTSVVV